MGGIWARNEAEGRSEGSLWGTLRHAWGRAGLQVCLESRSVLGGKAGKGSLGQVVESLHRVGERLVAALAPPP